MIGYENDTDKVYQAFFNNIENFEIPLVFNSIVITLLQTYWFIVCNPTFAEVTKLPGLRFPVFWPEKKLYAVPSVQVKGSLIISAWRFDLFYRQIFMTVKPLEERHCLVLMSLWQCQLIGIKDAGKSLDTCK